ncbi:hypothetical protein [Actinomadura hibisca]|uniref:hypothetical protein n=1 Tax=Actinomadura hibisca TaxID=68565 RepID=UPI00083783C4|nr:hypothetical protein [Actinomadura hibisca]
MGNAAEARRSVLEHPDRPVDPPPAQAQARPSAPTGTALVFLCAALAACALTVGGTLAAALDGQGLAHEGAPAILGLVRTAFTWIVLLMTALGIRVVTGPQDSARRATRRTAASGIRAVTGPRDSTRRAARPAIVRIVVVAALGAIVGAACAVLPQWPLPGGGPEADGGTLLPVAAVPMAAVLACWPRPFALAGAAESRVIIGTALGLVAGGAVVTGALAGQLPLATAGAVMGLAVLVVLGPVPFGRPAALLTAGAGAALLLTALAGTLRAAPAEALGRSFHGTHIVAGDGAEIPARLAGEAARLPEVVAAAGLGRTQMRVEGRPTGVTVAEPALLAHVLDLGVVAGTLGDALAVSQDEAAERGWRVGSRVTVAYAGGSRQTLAIGAIYRDTGLVGDYLMPRSPWSAHTADTPDTVAFVQVRAGGEAALARLVRSHGAPLVQERAVYLTAQEDDRARIRILGTALLTLTVLLALPGVVVASSRSRAAVLIAGTTGGALLGLVLGWALAAAMAVPVTVAW